MKWWLEAQKTLNSSVDIVLLYLRSMKNNNKNKK